MVVWFLPPHSRGKAGMGVSSQEASLTFARGASLPDPKKLFNASLEGNTRHAIDIREGEKLNEAAFKKLIQSAAAATSAALAKRASPKK